MADFNNFFLNLLFYDKNNLFYDFVFVLSFNDIFVYLPTLYLWVEGQVINMINFSLLGSWVK